MLSRQYLNASLTGNLMLPTSPIAGSDFAPIQHHALAYTIREIEYDIFKSC
jgi:hypothetical protein